MKAGVRCPCCGTEFKDRLDPYKLIDHLELGGVRRVILRTLAANFGRDVATELIAYHAYSGARDGGPDTALEGIKVHAYQLRKILQPYGLTVTGNPGGSFRLDWVDAPAVLNAGIFA